MPNKDQGPIIWRGMQFPQSSHKHCSSKINYKPNISVWQYEDTFSFFKKIINNFDDVFEEFISHAPSLSLEPVAGDSGQREEAYMGGKADDRRPYLEPG